MRPGFRPDRIGLYAVLLGALLILVAASSSHAAIRAGHALRTSHRATASARVDPAAMWTPGGTLAHR